MAQPTTAQLADALLRSLRTPACRDPAETERFQKEYNWPLRVAQLSKALDEIALAPATVNPPSPNAARISAIIPTCHRRRELTETITRILKCDPPPAELLIHADDNDRVSVAVAKSFPQVRVFGSPTCVGPGGGRNRLLAGATYPLVASFDDDSYPVDGDYFGRLQEIFERFPQAAVVAAAIFHRGESIAASDAVFQWVASFVGCGCAYRREAFAKTDGYVPLPLSYGMEELDLSLQLHELGWGILEAPSLHVRHDTTRRHHGNPDITAATIANIFLLTYLRYPVGHWLMGLGQVFNRVAWLIRHGRWKGIATGFIRTPMLVKAWAHRRRTISTETLRRWRELRHQPKAADGVAGEKSSAEVATQHGS